MQHRIRAAAIIVRDNKLLLVMHRHPRTGVEWWVPPGGGIEDRENIYDCARREVHEETGLTVELGQILYLREFVDLEQTWHMLEVFILATSFQGELTTANINPLAPEAAYIREVRFLSQDEMQGLTVYPEILKDKFWQDLASGKKLEIQYLGQQTG